MKVQSDSPTAAKERFNWMMVMVVTRDFISAFIDIWAVFQRAKMLDCNVFVKLLKDIRKNGIIVEETAL